MTRERADRLLMLRGLAASRTRAQSLIAAGQVRAAGRSVSRVDQRLPVDVSLEVLGSDHPWVSRGGLKLAHALNAFGIEPAGAICLDIGASTGGFTDVLLSCGATRVYAVDVGHDQLHPRLRSDPRVIVLEGVNARVLGRDQVPEPIDLLVCDASFISLEKLLPAPMRLVRAGGRLIALVKPQFEVGRENLGKNAVIRDPDVHREVCARVRAWLGGQAGWTVIGLVPSPVEGTKGNREFLLAGAFEG